MQFLLDSNAWIAWLRKSHAGLVAKITQAGPANVLMCSVVVGELIYGAEKSGPAFRAANLLNVHQLRLQFSSLPFDDRAAEEYGRIRAHLAALGTPIGSNDLMIAAIAIANQLKLVTHDTADFSRIPGLLLEDWQTP